MKKLYFLTVFFSFTSLVAQTKQHALKGERSKNGDLFFNLDLKPKISTETRSHFPIDDSAIILVPSSYTIYLMAYNPLHYTHKQGLKITIDPISNNLWDQLITLSDEKNEKSNFERNSFMNFCDTNKTVQNPLLIEQMNILLTKINSDKSQQCLALTKQLFALKFENENQTLNSIAEIKDSLQKIETEYLSIKGLIDKCENFFEYELTGSKNIDLTLDSSQQKYLLLDLLTKIKTKYKEHNKRITNLNQMIISMEKTIEGWKSYDGTTDDNWYIFLEAKVIDIGEEHQFEISLEHHERTIAGETVSKEEGTKLTKKLIIRRFSRFVPEISAGTIYSFQKKPNYTTELNADGNLQVANGKNLKLEQIELTAMLNWVMYSNSSDVLPFIQVGIGINDDVPLGLIGGGLRFQFGNNRHFSLSGGVSITGIKELSALKLGALVKDDKELRDDLNYEVSTLKGYFGIQYNF